MPFLLAGLLNAHMEDQQTATFSKKILVRLFFLSNTELRNPLDIKATLSQCSITVSLETVGSHISCAYIIEDYLRCQDA